MQFKVLVSFFFAYIAAVQAFPIGVPELPTDAVVGVIPISVNVPVDVRALPTDELMSKLPLDVTSVFTGEVLDILPLDVKEVLSLKGLSALSVPGILEGLPVDVVAKILKLLPRDKLEDLLHDLPLDKVSSLLEILPLETVQSLDLSEIPVNLPVRRNIPDTLAGVENTASAVIPLDVHNTLPLSSLGKRDGGVLSGLDMPIRGALTPVVDGAAYAAHVVVGSVTEKLPTDKRQLGDGLPAVPSTEGVVPELKVSEVPAIPTLPLKTRQVDLPALDTLNLDGVTNKVATTKIVRRYVRRQESGCADAPARRSLDDIKVPDVPAVKAVEVPSIPSLPIN